MQTECIDCTQGCARPSPPPIPSAPPATWPLPPSPPPDVAEYWTEGHFVQTNAFALPPGESLLIKGVSWFGLESRSCYIGEGAAGPLSAYADFLKFHGFNAVRMPLAADAVIADRRARCLNQGIYVTNNPELEGLSYLTVVERFIELLGEHGLLVLLDVHNMRAGEWPEQGWPATPLGATEGISTLRTTWRILAKRFCNPRRFWNVFAADLKNEPHGLYWGPAQGDASLYPANMRWDSTAGAIGTEVHRLCSRWLLFVEGVGQCRDVVSTDNNEAHHPCQHPAAVGQDTTYNAFWGENLQGVRMSPILITDERDGEPVHDKVVYSPHSYGPGVFAQHYFQDSDFASHMPAIWDMQYGFISRDDAAPVIIGEWGGRGNGDDGIWQEAFREYLTERQIGSFYWSLNPESQDTGGLIVGWELPIVPEDAKLRMLSYLPSSPVPAAIDRIWGGAAVYHRRPAFPRPPPPPLQSPPLGRSPPPPNVASPATQRNEDEVWFTDLYNRLSYVSPPPLPWRAPSMPPEEVHEENSATIPFFMVATSMLSMLLVLRNWRRICKAKGSTMVPQSEIIADSFAPSIDDSVGHWFRDRAPRRAYAQRNTSTLAPRDASKDRGWLREGRRKTRQAPKTIEVSKDSALVQEPMESSRQYSSVGQVAERLSAKATPSLLSHTHHLELDLASELD